MGKAVPKTNSVLGCGLTAFYTLKILVVALPSEVMADRITANQEKYKVI